MMLKYNISTSSLSVQRNILPPYSKLKSKSSKNQQEAPCLPFLAGSLIYSSILKMEVVCSSDTSVNFCWIKTVFHPRRQYSSIQYGDSIK
jgi:hypothetical protein